MVSRTTPLNRRSQSNPSVCRIVVYPSLRRVLPERGDLVEQGPQGSRLALAHRPYPEGVDQMSFTTIRFADGSTGTSRFSTASVTSVPWASQKTTTRRLPLTSARKSVFVRSSWRTTSGANQSCPRPAAAAEPSHAWSESKPMLTTRHRIAWAAWVKMPCRIAVAPAELQDEVGLECHCQLIELLPALEREVERRRNRRPRAAARSAPAARAAMIDHLLSESIRWLAKSRRPPPSGRGDCVSRRLGG